jgi:hypothetical protein
MGHQTSADTGPSANSEHRRKRLLRTVHGDGGGTWGPTEAVAPDERLAWSRTIGIGTQHVIPMFGGRGGGVGGRCRVTSPRSPGGSGSWPS